MAEQRIIKFRAWDTEAHKMVTDFVIAPTSPTWGAFPIEQPDEQLRSALTAYEYRHDNGPLAGHGDYTLVDWSNYYGLMNYKLMQFIGVLDQNGKQIYEGDIIRCKYMRKTALYSIGELDAYGVAAQMIIPYTGYYLYAHIAHKDTAIVIGNVYETPELISSET